MKKANNVTTISVIKLSLMEVFKKPSYVILSLVVFATVLLIVIWLPNLYFVSHTITTSEMALPQKINLLIASLGALDTNFTFESKYVTIIASFLAAINVSLLVYYFKKRIRLQKEAGGSIGGVLLGFLGVGCASCGSVVLSSVFGVTATAGFLGRFPFHGLEFAVLGIVFILLSIILLTKKIQEEIYCKV